MNPSMTSGEFQAHTEQVERLVQRVSGLADEDARSTSLELLQSLMDFHGAVLSRIVESFSDWEKPVEIHSRNLALTR